MPDAIETLITDLQQHKYSARDQIVICSIDNFIAALNEIETTVGPVSTPQTANTVFAGPTTGPAATPTFRALVGADLPDPSAASLGGVQSKVVVANEFLTGISVLGVPSAAQPASTNLSDVSIGTWTPIDTSGAGLVFTAVNGNYTKIGNMVFAYFDLTYPATGDGSVAQIGGLPFTVANLSAVGSSGILDANGVLAAGTLNSIALSASTNFRPNYANGNAHASNVQLSTVSLGGIISYPVS